MEIELCGYKVLIDDEDYESISSMVWRVKKEDLHKGLVYFRSGYKDCKTLHRLVLGLEKGVGIVDHKDGDTLNNKKENLRVVTVSQNNMNRKNNPNKYGLKGVKQNKKSKTKPYCAVIQVAKKSIYLGSFESPELAHLAYCEASKKYHGEYGRTE